MQTFLGVDLLGIIREKREVEGPIAAVCFIPILQPSSPLLFLPPPNPHLLPIRRIRPQRQTIITTLIIQPALLLLCTPECAHFTLPINRLLAVVPASNTRMLLRLVAVAEGVARVHAGVQAVAI